MTPEHHLSYANAIFSSIEGYIRKIQAELSAYYDTTRLLEIDKSNVSAMEEAVKALSVRCSTTLAEIEKDRSQPHTLK